MMLPESISRWSSIVDAIRWIHQELPTSEQQLILEEVDRDVESGRNPEVSTSSDRGILNAAVYFRRLPGKVASLGGLRAADGHQAACSALLKQITRQLTDDSTNCLVQAIVGKSDTDKHQLLNCNGFARHTDVLQLCYQPNLVSLPDSRLPPEMSWESAGNRNTEELVNLVEATFQSTLDCPVLNRLRSPHDVLTGFQDERSPEDLQHWYVLVDNASRDDVGCLFLLQHSSELLEIVYFGITPRIRGRGLGSSLIAKAIATAGELGGQLLVAGVDGANWPALQAYYRQGFQMLQAKSVFFLESDLSRSVDHRQGRVVSSR